MGASYTRPLQEPTAIRGGKPERSGEERANVARLGIMAPLILRNHAFTEIGGETTSHPHQRSCQRDKGWAHGSGLCYATVCQDRNWLYPSLPRDGIWWMEGAGWGENIQQCGVTILSSNAKLYQGALGPCRTCGSKTMLPGVYPNHSTKSINTER